MIEKSGMVIAIDGPAGAGKSTLARRLADALELPFLTTGLMYRAVALRALRRGIDVEDAEGLAELAKGLRFALDEGPEGLRVDGEMPSPELRSSEVESVVSAVARHPEVRSVLRDVQRSLGAGGGVVEGRDIGTVVFPDADVKVFVEADPAERAARRQVERGDTAPLAEELARRDALDARTNPLEPAHDAHLVDTTGRDPDQVLAMVLELIRREAG